MLPKKLEEDELEQMKEKIEVSTPEAEQVSPLNQAKVREILMMPVQAAEAWYRSYKSIYERLENLYFSNLAYGRGDDRIESERNSYARSLPTQYSSGQAFQIVETMLPRLVAGKIRCEVIGQEESDKKGAKFSEKVLNFQIESDHLDEKLEDYIRQATKTLGILKIDVKTEKIKTFRRGHKYEMKVPFTSKRVGFGPEKEIEEVKDKFTHVLQTIPYEDLIVPRGTSQDSLPFLGVKIKKTIREMRDDGRYINMDLTSMLSMIGQTLDEFTKEREEQQDVTYSDPIGFFLEKEVVIKEIYYRYEGRMYLSAFTEQGDIMVRNEVLKFWHNKFPIRLLSLIPVENQVIGLSPLQTTEDEINMLDDWTNIILSVAMYDVLKPTLYDPKRTGINWRKNPPVYGPGMMYPMNDPRNSFIVLNTPKIDTSHQFILEYLERRTQNKSAVTDYISGTDEVEGDKTLGEVKLKTAQANRRFQLIIKRIRRELSVVFSMMNANNQQFLPDKYPVRIFGEKGWEWEKLSSESIQGNFDHRVKGYENILSEMVERVQKYRAMLADGIKFPQIVNVPEIIRMLFEDGYQVEEMDRIIIPVQEQLQDRDNAKKQVAQQAAKENENPVTAVVRPDEDHAIHLTVHTAFLQSPAFKQLPREHQGALVRHIDATRKAMAVKNKNEAVGKGKRPPRGQTPIPPFGDLVRPTERQVKK